MNPTLLFVQAEKLSYNSAAQSRFLYISKELQNIGYKSIVIGKSLKKDINNKMVSLPFVKEKSLFSRIIQDIQIYLYSFKYILFSNIRFVYVRRTNILIPIIIFAKLCGKKVIYDFHGYRLINSTFPRKINSSQRVDRYLELQLLKVSDYVITVSETLKSQLPPKYQKKTLVIENSVDLGIFKNQLGIKQIKFLKEKYGIKDENKKVVFFVVGGSRSEYYPEDLIEMQRYVDNIYSLIVCNLTAYRNLKKISAKYDDVLLYDNIPNQEVISILKYVADICIIPYDKDSPNSHIKNYCCCRKSSEYLASGKPIIISEVERIPVYLKEKENYITYKSKDPQDLADKINLLLENKNLYEQMCRNNSELAQKVTWGESIKKSGILNILDKRI